MFNLILTTMKIKNDIIEVTSIFNKKVNIIVNNISSIHQCTVSDALSKVVREDGAKLDMVNSSNIYTKESRAEVLKLITG